MHFLILNHVTAKKSSAHNYGNNDQRLKQFSICAVFSTACYLCDYSILLFVTKVPFLLTQLNFVFLGQIQTKSLQQVQ